MFNKKVLGALAKLVALLLLAQAALVIIMSVMAYSGAPAQLDPSVTQAIAIIQQLGSIAFLYVVLGAAYRLATKKHCKKGMMCEKCPNCGNCKDECTCSDSMSMPAKKAPAKKTAAKKTTTRKSTAKKKTTSRSKKK